MRHEVDALITGRLELGAVGRPLPGARESGDDYLVAPSAGGVLLAVADGLGHGPEAAAVARAALEQVARHRDASLESLMRLAHGAALRTRGLTMSLARLDPDARTVAWLGVGNVSGVLVRASPDSATRRVEALVVRTGVVGQRLPALRATTHAWGPADVLAVATDGVERDFVDDVRGPAPVRELAERVMARRATGRDDALIVLVRCLAGGS
ncbi:MAG TPA: SpoIIE family protein phosphatase [Candidatus Eisenbacteria bacterium]|nr:SpoIIE family protein phosphatase [Candidatus Eisenbacteria bacterium]